MLLGDDVAGLQIAPQHDPDLDLIVEEFDVRGADDVPIGARQRRAGLAKDQVPGALGSARLLGVSSVVEALADHRPVAGHRAHQACRGNGRGLAGLRQAQATFERRDQLARRGRIGRDLAHLDLVFRTRGRIGHQQTPAGATGALETNNHR